MAGTMVRISETARTNLRALATQSHETMQEVLERAIEEYRRKRFFDELDAAYEALRRDPNEWQGVLDERAAWDQTLMDGLEDE